MVSRGEFRHDPAVLKMQFDLGIKLVGEQTVHGVVQGDTGVITGSFDTEHTHRAILHGCGRGIMV